jgi:hypothetical protein
MPLISKQDLLRTSTGRVKNPAAISLLRNSAKRKVDSRERFDIFLSHSFVDATLVLSLSNYLESFGYSVFVDWIESPQLDRGLVSKKTASHLRRVMNRSHALLFAISDNSSVSKWMPWELGYFDGRGGKIAIVPVTEQASESNSFSGQEYLGLYPYVIAQQYQSRKKRLWVSKSKSRFLAFEAWMSDL